jgi:hypothetical protein
MNKVIFCACLLLSACSEHDVNIDPNYVKDCNDKGGKVERIEYSSMLQCVGLPVEDKQQ